MKTLIWAGFALVALVWTGLAAATAGLTEWALAALASGQATQTAGAVAQWPVPPWLALWIDPAAVQALQTMWLDTVRWLGEVLPMLGGVGGWLAALVWIGWGIGLVLLLVAAVAAHWLASRAGRAFGGARPA